MLLMSFRARVLLGLIALLLLIPVAGIRLQDETRLVRFHNRGLSPLPAAAQFTSDPVEYFRQGKAWLADRAYPILQAAMLQKKILFYVLKTPPQRRVTLGSDGYIFVNGGSEDTVNGILANVCVNSHKDSVAAQLSEGLPAAVEFARSRNMAVDVVIIPTAMTLYANHLPASVPQQYRDACNERYAGNSPLARLTAPAGMSYLFPFQPMKAASVDEAFFPKGHWHASGMSLKVVRDTYLAAIGVTRPVDDRLERGEAPSEIMGSYGMQVNLPVYFVRNPHVQFDAERNATFNAAIHERFQGNQATTRAYSNANPVIDESVMMLSDSYGEFSSEVFAGAFRHVVQVTSNNLPRQNVVDVIDRTREKFKVDRLILLVQEGGVGDLIVWSGAFRSAPAAPSTASTAP
jgi:hypothetical protein